jgi:hypothetical protein
VAEAMRAKMLSATFAIGLSLGLAACGSTGSSSSGTTTSTTTKSGVAYSSTQLQSMLLTTSDVPYGFSTEDSSQNSNTSIISPAACDIFPSATKPSNSTLAVASATIAFSAGTLGPFLGEELQGFSSEQKAKADMKKLGVTASTCNKFQTTDSDGAVSDYTVGSLSFPKGGNDLVAYRVSITGEGVSGSFDLVICRKGSIKIQTYILSAVTILGSSTSKPGDFQKFTTDAIRKVQQ